jgi:hypothetical protein
MEFDSDGRAAFRPDAGASQEQSRDGGRLVVSIDRTRKARHRRALRVSSPAGWAPYYRRGTGDRENPRGLSPGNPNWPSYFDGPFSYFSHEE